MTKEQHRNLAFSIRRGITDKEIKDRQIAKTLLAQPFYRDATVIMTYLSYKSEVDTLSLCRQMLSDGKILCAPVCGKAGEMKAYGFSDLSELSPSAMGILEPPQKRLFLPEAIDFIIVPGCAFTTQGYRLGYGGGYYDRYLPNTDAVTCGIFYEALKTEFTPDETDVSLSYIITEENIYRFR